MEQDSNITVDATPEQNGQTASVNIIDDQEVYYFLRKTDAGYDTLFIGWMSKELMKALLMLEPGYKATVRFSIGEVTLGVEFEGPVYLLKYGNLEALAHAGDDRKLDLFPSGNTPELEDSERIIAYPTYWTKDVEPLLDWKIDGKIFRQENGQWIEVTVHEVVGNGEQPMTEAEVGKLADDICASHTGEAAANSGTAGIGGSGSGAGTTEPMEAGMQFDLRAKLREDQPLTLEHVRAFAMALAKIHVETNDPALKKSLDEEVAHLTVATTNKELNAFLHRLGEMLLIFLTAKSFLEVWEKEPGIPDSLRDDLRKGLVEDDSPIFANQLINSTQRSGYFGWDGLWKGGPRSRYPLLHEAVEIPADKVASTAHVVRILQAYKKSADGNRWHPPTPPDPNDEIGGSLANMTETS